MASSSVEEASSATAPPRKKGPLPPPDASAEKVTPDGGVLKSVIVAAKAGGGAKKPPLHSRCLVHYEGFLRDTGEPFVRSAEEGRSPGEPAVVVAGRDASLRATGLNLAVASMQVGEEARVWVEDGDRYGYGPRGSFSFPAVPPSTRLVYDVKLVAFDPPEDDEDGDESDSDGGGGGAVERSGGGDVDGEKRKKKKPPRPSGTLTYEERLEAAIRRRLRGNALLTGAVSEEDGKERKRSDPAAALAQYQMSLSYLDDDFLFQLEGPHLEAASSAARSARLNCAAARLALGDARGARDDATAVLRERPRDAKALYRRGKARRALGDSRGALEDLRSALLAEDEQGSTWKDGSRRPDAALARELASAEAEVRASERAGDAVFRRAFASVGKRGLMLDESKGEEEETPFRFDEGDEMEGGSAGSRRRNARLSRGFSAPSSSTVAIFVAVAAVGVAIAVAAAASLRSLFASPAYKNENE